MIFKKIQLSFGLILKIAGSIILLTVAGFFAYNQITSILEKKNEINYNLLSNCVIDSEEDSAKTLADQKECFKKYKIDTRFVNFSEKIEQAGAVNDIIREHYSSVDQQSENSQIQEWISPVLNFLAFFVSFIFVSVLFSVFAGLIIRFTTTRSQARKENTITDQTDQKEEEDDCQCDDCLKEKNKD